MGGDCCDNLVVIRFGFRSRPVMEISPWGPDRRLHWFGLTDGWYWIEIDGLELLRYTPQAVQGWIGGEPAASIPYVDYYVVRLWEDMLSLLPAVLEPVPDDLAELTSSDPDEWVSPDEEQAEAAGEWYGSHVLDMGYIRCPPSGQATMTTSAFVEAVEASGPGDVAITDAPRCLRPTGQRSVRGLASFWAADASNEGSVMNRLVSDPLS